MITHGGTYSGDFSSADPAVPAVTIATAEPVVLQKASVRGPGNLIVSRAAHVDVRIVEVRGESTPSPGRAPGRFVSIEGFDLVAVENCSLERTGGIYLLDYAGGAAAGHGVSVVRNRATDIDGRRRDEHGGVDPKREELVQFVQLDKVRNAPNVEIAWNEVVNAPGKSRVEDVISIYLSSGTAGSPIRIHDNFIRGAFPSDPAKGDYSGGGIMLGDGVAPDPAGDPAFVEAYDNVVLDTVNYGIAASAGHDLRFYRNRVLSVGLLPDGSRPRAQNVGAYVWDSYKAGPARFYRNGGSDNLIGWATPAGGRNDWWRPNAAAWTNNRPWPGMPTREAYDAEHVRWLERARAANVSIGPPSPAEDQPRKFSSATLPQLPSGER